MNELQSYFSWKSECGRKNRVFSRLLITLRQCINLHFNEVHFGAVGTLLMQRHTSSASLNVGDDQVIPYPIAPS